MTTPPGGSRLAEDLPEDLFGPTLAPQWSHDGKGAALLEGGRAPQAKSRPAEDRPWRGQDDKGGDSWTGGGGGLQGLRAPIDAAVRPRWREDERQNGPRRPDARWGVAEHDGVRRAENGPQRPLADIPALAGSPVERWGGDAGRGRGRGPPGPTPPRWGAPGPERHQHPDRWGGPIAPETRPREARDKWEKWGGFEGGPKEPHMPHDDKWRPPHAGFGHSPGAGPRDVPSFGPAGGHAFMEPRGDPVPAGRGRGFAIGRGRSISGPAHAPGADNRWGAHHSHPPAFSDDSYAVGRQPSKHDPSQYLGSKAKYPSSKMLAVFSQLEAKHALALPAGVNRDEPSLFAVSGSNSAPYMGPNSESSARLDELETGSNITSVPEPARPAAEPIGMDLIHMLTRGHSGASTSQSALPTPRPDSLAQFTGLQQGLSAAAPWGHQAQTGSAASGPFDNSNPILGPVGSGLAPHDPFASRPFNQPMRQDPPQQHALPAFLTSASNHAADRSHSVLQDRGMFSQPFASHPQASLDHLNLGAAGLGMQPQQQQQQHQQSSLWGGQQHAQSTAQLFGGLKRPEQQQQPQQPQPGVQLEQQHQQQLQQQQRQQEQQQQRQQEQQQLPDWGLPSEAPASPKKAETKAPWGAAKPPVPAGGNLHDILREEEAKAAAVRAAQPVSTDVKTAAPGANRASGWARVAASPTASRGHVQTLKEIQEEEERARRSEARQQQTQQQQQPDQAQGGFSLRDSFVGEAQALVAPKMAPWAAAAGRHQEESASDLEGGDSGYHQEHFTQPPPPPPRKPAPAKEERKKTAQEVKREQMEEQRRAAAAARQEIKEDKKPKQAAAGPAPSMALRTAASLQRALSNDDDGMFWDYGPAAGQRGNGSIPAPAAAKPAGQANGRPPASQQWQSPQTSPGPPPNKPMPQDIPATPETIKMSSEFKTWASQKIRSLSKGRIDDPSILLDVLMDTPSNGEVVEGCLVNIERNGDVSAFATEFIRRKAAELAGHKGKAKAVSAAVPLGSSSAAAPIPAAAVSDPSKFQKVPKANKGKKGKASKGQKVGNQLLGFSTKSDFSVLERGDDYA
ncbi:hypothetical protein WJX82_000480 [Trebouxia sp. C0006]